MSFAFDREIIVEVAGRVMSDLRVDFKIKKELSLKPSTFEIVIYNLSRKTINEFQQLSTKKGTKGIPVAIYGGYRNENKEKPPLLISGDLRNVISQLAPPEWITTVTGGDGERAFQVSQIKFVYAENTNFKDIAINTAVKFAQDLSGSVLNTFQYRQEIAALLAEENAQLQGGGQTVSSSYVQDGSVYIGNNVSLAHQSQIHGPSKIGNNVFVGMQSFVFKSNIDDNVVIEPGAKVIGVNIKANSYVPAGSIIKTQEDADKLPKIDSNYAYK